jgi:demethylmenaquinone methyltransferase/2-methoxy-6-polyprenyl-1,4-benzoquinol methylase
MRKFDHFNLIGPIYDWIFGGRNHDKLLAWVNLEPQARLLDLGGGTGRISMQFSDGYSEIIVADPAEKMLKEAHKKGLTTVNASAERLPFANGVFDRIFMVDVFHHVADQQQTMDEIWRTLAPGGRLVIEEPDILHWFVKLIALAEKLLLMRSHFLKPQEILAMGSYDDVDNAQIDSEKGIAWVIIDKRP